MATSILNFKRTIADNCINKSNKESLFGYYELIQQGWDMFTPDRV